MQRFSLAVVIVLLVLVTGCGTGTGSKTSDAVDVTATLHNNNGKVSLHIENTGEKPVSINSFIVTNLEGDILFTDKKYDGWFPLTLNPGSRWEFYDKGGSADVIYRAVVVFSGKRNHSILVEQINTGCPDVVPSAAHRGGGSVGLEVVAKKEKGLTYVAEVVVSIPDKT